MTDTEVRYSIWCGEVVDGMVILDRVRNMRYHEGAVEFLERCRGDEPRDCFEAEESVEEYVHYLSTPCPEDGDDGFLDPETVI